MIDNRIYDLVSSDFFAIQFKIDHIKKLIRESSLECKSECIEMFAPIFQLLNAIGDKIFSEEHSST